MSWLVSIVVGVLTGLLGGILTGLIASLAVDWYRVPSREGESGYFVLFLILLTLIVGFLIGIAVSRQVAARPDPGFLKAFGLSLVICLAIIGAIGGVARLLADVGPTIGGKSLLLNVELQWPEDVEPPPSSDSGMWIRLSSASGKVVRTSEAGPMWREDARLEAGKWIVPGAVDLFTSRGQRMISFEPTGTIPNGYIVPLGAWPGKSRLVRSG
jgi:MFS family permease